MMTINEHIEEVKAEFAKLKSATRKALARKAVAHINSNPGMADANGFWRGLSARHVIEANCGK